MTPSWRRGVVALAAVAVTACQPGGDLASPSPPPVAPTVSATAPAAVPVTPAPPSRPRPQPSPREHSTAPVEPTLATARTPAQLAQLLAGAETAVRDPAVQGRALAASAHMQQLVYRRLARSPLQARKVLRQLPAPLRPAARANLRASTSLSSLVTPQKELPDWRIVRPAPAQQLLRHYHAAADRFGLQWQYLAAINLVETRMGRIRGRSTAGAQGPMQFMPATWDAYGRGDVNDPGDAIEAAARYLAANGGAQNIRGALWHYNHSDRYVEAVAAYADVMRDNPQAYRGYYHWQVYYRTRKGDLLLPVGYGS